MGSPRHQGGAHSLVENTEQRPEKGVLIVWLQGLAGGMVCVCVGVARERMRGREGGREREREEREFWMGFTKN
jgi:hypothetical protein